MMIALKDGEIASLKQKLVEMECRALTAEGQIPPPASPANAS